MYYNNPSFNYVAGVVLSAERSTFFDYLIQAIFCLLFLGLYMNQGGHNTTAFLSLCICVPYLFKHREAVVDFFSSFRLFYTFVFLYVFLYISINLYHFGFDDGLKYALQRIRWVLFVAVMLPAFFVCSQKACSKKIVKIFLLLFIVLSIIILSDSLLRFYDSNNNIAHFFGSSHLSLGRPGWLYNPIVFSKIALFSCLAFLLLVIQVENKAVKWVFFFLSVIWLVASIITQVRAAWIGIFLAFIFVIVFSRSKKVSLFLLLIGILLLSVIVTNNNFSPRIKNMFNASSFSEQYRLGQWEANLKLSLDHPVLGVGYAKNRNPDLMKEYVTNEKLGYGQPHNQYIDIIAGVGYPAFFIWLYMLFLPVFYGLRLTFGLAGSFRFVPLAAVFFNIFMLTTILFDKLNSIGWLCIVYSWLLIFYLYKKHFLSDGGNNDVPASINS